MAAHEVLEEHFMERSFGFASQFRVIGHCFTYEDESTDELHIASIKNWLGFPAIHSLKFRHFRHN